MGAVEAVFPGCFLGSMGRPRKHFVSGPVSAEGRRVALILPESGEAQEACCGESFFLFWFGLEQMATT